MRAHRTSLLVAVLAAIAAEAAIPAPPGTALAQTTAAGSPATAPAAAATSGSNPSDSLSHCLNPTALDLTRLLAPPPSAGSREERAELDELERLQRARTPEEAAQARADADISVSRFAQALGARAPLNAASAPRTTELVSELTAAGSALVGSAKDKFARPRPFLVDSRLAPIIVRPMSAAYPSGHSTWAYAVGLVLADIVPERRNEILARAQEFAHNRSVAGVHYPSDVLAGEIAGTAIAASLFACRPFQVEEAAVAAELRPLLGLPREPHPAP